MEQILSSILSGITIISTFIGTIAAGGVVAFFILPHIAGVIHANIKNTIWITILIAALIQWVFIPLITPAITLMQASLAMMFYHLIPYENALALLDTFYIYLTLLIIRRIFHPNDHEQKQS